MWTRQNIWKRKGKIQEQILKNTLRKTQKIAVLKIALYDFLVFTLKIARYSGGCMSLHF